MGEAGPSFNKMVDRGCVASAGPAIVHCSIRQDSRNPFRQDKKSIYLTSNYPGAMNPPREQWMRYVTSAMTKVPVAFEEALN